MRRAAIVLGLVLAVAACNGWYRVTVSMPYCPASDSAKQAADSIPVLCLFPDTARDSTA